MEDACFNAVQMLLIAPSEQASQQSHHFSDFLVQLLAPKQQMQEYSSLHVCQAMNCKMRLTADL